MPKDVNETNNNHSHDCIDNIPANSSGNRPFYDILASSVSRRLLLSGSLTAAVTSFLGCSGDEGETLSQAEDIQEVSRLVSFKPVAISDVVDTTQPTISDDYQYQVLIPWGTPIQPNITAEYKGDPSTRPTPDQALNQVGMGHDGMHFFPIDTHLGIAFASQGYKMSNYLGMLCVNHEYGKNTHALGRSTPESLDDVLLSQSVHGVSVVAVSKKFNRWSVVKNPSARRITVNTPVEFSGPAADSALLKNTNNSDFLGTVNNCGSGFTPWGTYLTCEENFNGYFGASKSYTPTVEQSRYSLSSSGFGYDWFKFDERFDLSSLQYQNEQHRFGWVVEIDPFNPHKKPIKRTALGRFKHEAVAIAEADSGQIAAYMGDDQQFDYCYKYLSNKNWKLSLAEGQSPLDDGCLFVAKFNEDGTGEWLELTIDNPILKDRFETQEEVLIYARIAADLLGATPMDRPEWASVGEDGTVFWSLTINTPNPVTNINSATAGGDGQIIRTKDTDNYLGRQFEWDVFILASSTRGEEHVFSGPDLSWTDPEGRLFIGTDNAQSNGLQNQLVVFDTTLKKAQPRRLLVGVNGDEITGFTVTPDQKTAFVNIQHPGAGQPLSTNFPASTDGETIPRDCTLVITRKDGGLIGS